MQNELFEKAALIKLTTSVWSASKSVDPVFLENIGQDSSWIKGRKLLISPECLGPIKTAAHQARNRVRKYALPFPLQSIQLIPREYIYRVDEALNHFEKRFWSRVDEFEDIYAQAREEAKMILGNLFDESDYPVRIREKFRFEWQFMALEVPGKSTLLSPELYEKEKAKFTSMMNETRELCSNALKEEFAGILSHLTDRLENPEQPKIINNSMFNRLHEFLEDMQNKNIFQDEELNTLTEEARAIITNVSPNSLKYSSDMRSRVKEDMDGLRKSIEESIIDMPRRQIRINEKAA